MERLSARLLCFASVCVAVMNVGCGDDAPPLQQGDLDGPATVATLLLDGVDRSDKRRAELFFSEGVKYREPALAKGNWGPVAKSFGASALHNPRPLTLVRYAEAEMRSYGESPPAIKDPKVVRDFLLHARAVYETTLGADDILHELTPAQRAEVDAHNECIDQYLKDGTTLTPCPPLDWLRANAATPSDPG